MGNPNAESVPGFLLESDGVLDSEDEEQVMSSIIIQCDGADTVSTSSDEMNSFSSTVIATNEISEGSQFSSEDEFDAAPVQAVLVPAPDQPSIGQNLVLTVDSMGGEILPLSLPLFYILNARSLYNKINNFKRFLREIGPSCVLVSESWEVEGRVPLETLLNSTHFKVISYKRGRGQSGGGAAIIYDSLLKWGMK